MSGQSLVMFVSVLAIALAANRADDTSWTKARDQAVARGPASIAGKKELGFVQKEALKRTHKLRGPLAAMVELIGAQPERPGDVFVLKGVVSAEAQLSNVEFKWILPTGVEIVNGQASSVIAVLSEDKPFETQITLRQLAADNARVSLKVRGRDAGTRFSDTAQYHTLDQKVIEASRKALHKKMEDYVKDEKKLKIFH